MGKMEGGEFVTIKEFIEGGFTNPVWKVPSFCHQW